MLIWSLNIWFHGPLLQVITRVPQEKHRTIARKTAQVHTPRLPKMGSLTRGLEYGQS